MIVKIKEKEITLKKTMRSYVMYESINDGKMFAPRTLTDMITYFYCVVCSSEKGLEISYSDFLDWMDDNEGCLEEFTAWINETNTQTDIPGKKKKTKTKKVSQ